MSVPVATYRLQLTPDFTLDDAAAVVPYLARLGVSHVYTSSYLTAAPGSSHGYDVVDPGTVDPQLGGEAALERFRAALLRSGLGNVVDVVPNHMGIAGPENPWWWDVLRHGRASRFASWFDIDWDRGPFPGRILLPRLGRPYGEELAAGNLRLVDSADGPEVAYFEHRFPIDPATFTVTALPERPEDIHGLLEAQHYRLAWWRVGREQLNYRRFFDVSTLAGVRVEDPQVFAATHRRTLQWVHDGVVDGLRIDHPDGLRDPGEYLRRLRQAAPDAWIVVEKILEPSEALPSDWPVDGTTGYDAMRLLTGLFVDPQGEATLDEMWHTISGCTLDGAGGVALGKRQAATDTLTAELSRIVEIACRIATRSIVARDVTPTMMREAIVAVLVHTSVYRTYATDNHPLTPEDAAIRQAAIAAARDACADIDASTFDMIDALWAGEFADDDAAEFRARLQQLSGATMAKGSEDTAFYRCHRLIALNEVGGDLDRFSVSATEFHAAMTAAAHERPRSMIATSTHDTKRSEDVRLRIALLSAMTPEWQAAVQRWRALNAALWTSTPDPATEYLLYQTLVGAWPIDAARLVTFLRKAVREAKQHTSWTDPNAEYEQAVTGFAERVVTHEAFTSDLAEFVATAARPARMASLAQLAAKLTVPGVPDVYQGSELWTDSLVDPDNRRPVDFASRFAMLDASLASPDSDPLVADPLDADASGATKLRLLRLVLALRHAHRSSFDGAYAAVDVTGSNARAALAYRRGEDVVVALAVRPLDVARHGWGTTRLDLPAGSWRSVLPAPTTSDAGELISSVLLGDVMWYGSVTILVREPVGRP